MKIELTERIAGFPTVFGHSMRLPHNSHHKSDSRWYDHILDEEDIIVVDVVVDNGTEIPIVEREYNPRVIWDTDNGHEVFIVGEEDLKLAQKLIKAGDEHSKCIRGITTFITVTAPLYWWLEMDTYVVGRTPLSSSSSMHTECKHLIGEELQQVKGKLSGDYEYTRDFVTNYQTLRRMYFQRKSHRLPEWKQFCEFITTLPLAKELITIK